MKRGIWLHLRQRGAVSLAGVIPTLLLLGWILGSHTVPLPLANGARAPLALLLPAITGTALATLLLPTLPEAEALSSRKLHGLNYTYTLAVSGITCFASAALTPALDASYSGIATGRNTALMTGMAMVAAVTLSPLAAWALPALYVGLVITVGSAHGTESPAPWALPTQPDTSTSAALIAVVLFVAGVTLTARSAPHRPVDQQR